MSVEPRRRRVIIEDTAGAPISDSNPLPITGAISTSAGAVELTQYIFQDMDSPTSVLSYIGKQTNASKWLILKLDETAGILLRYANVSNNATQTNYTDAWANRASLTFEMLEELTGL